ncbi:MAG: class I SAM-dependent methyltransferase [Acidimicrobiia bacterium]
MVATETQRPRTARPSRVGAYITDLLGTDLPVRFDCYDGTRAGPESATTRVVVRSPEALQYIATAPGELGFARAYVAGQIDVEGDIFDALALRSQLPDVRLRASQWMALARLVGAAGLKRPPIPAEEVRLHGRRHSRARDAAAISHHYDVSNDFYRMVLGPSMTYSCAVWSSPDITLDDAQAAKYELICRKLGLRPGMRLLDVGCGWGGMAMHAARHYGVEAVGITLSHKQAEYARQAAADADLRAVEFRVQDYRDVDGRYDAISSIGMFEHVGLARLREYFTHLHELLRPGARLLNHGISRPADGHRSRFNRRGFIDRYVFPDGELHEIGSVVSRMQETGFEVRHVEGLREHYALTLRAWVRNLEANWEDAVATAGAGRARVWRLYMAGAALNFEDGGTQIHQVLGVRPDGGRSGVPWRPDW